MRQLEQSRGEEDASGTAVSSVVVLEVVLLLAAAPAAGARLEIRTKRQQGKTKREAGGTNGGLQGDWAREGVMLRGEESEEGRL